MSLNDHRVLQFGRPPPKNSFGLCVHGYHGLKCSLCGGIHVPEPGDMGNCLYLATHASLWVSPCGVVVSPMRPAVWYVRLWRLLTNPWTYLFTGYIRW